MTDSTECSCGINSHKFAVNLLVLTRRYFLAIFSCLRAGIKRRAGFNWGGGGFYRQVGPKEKRNQGVRSVAREGGAIQAREGGVYDHYERDPCGKSGGVGGLEM